MGSHIKIDEEYWFCPIYQRKIYETLCFEVSNIGSDVLQLSGDEKPPCTWEEAYKVCAVCPKYAEWGA